MGMSRLAAAIFNSSAAPGWQAVSVGLEHQDAAATGCVSLEQALGHDRAECPAADDDHVEVTAHPGKRD